MLFIYMNCHCLLNYEMLFKFVTKYCLRFGYSLIVFCINYLWTVNFGHFCFWLCFFFVFFEVDTVKGLWLKIHIILIQLFLMYLFKIRNGFSLWGCLSRYEQFDLFKHLGKLCFWVQLLINIYWNKLQEKLDSGNRETIKHTRPAVPDQFFMSLFYIPADTNALWS